MSEVTTEEVRPAVDDPDLDIPELPPDWFTRALRNPYQVRIAPDVWPLFPTAREVITALRAYATEHGLWADRPSHGAVFRRLADEQEALRRRSAARPTSEAPRVGSA